MPRPSSEIALNEVARLRTKIRSAGPTFIRSEECTRVMDLCERALNEAEAIITELRETVSVAAGRVSAYKGELAARDGREIILTMDRIGPNGVPTNHAEGTILACTDSDRRWRLNAAGEWVEL